MKAQIAELVKSVPALADAAALRETLWLNGKQRPFSAVEKAVPLEQIEDARARLERFAPYIAKVFPETRETRGIIESELAETCAMKAFLNQRYDAKIQGRLFLKKDSHLPIAGSIKARGGIYEVLKHAEDLAIGAGLLKETDDYSVLAEPKFREFFSRCKVQVGSTGNLGLSIGIMSAQLGFHVIVHMSADARQWKKDLLRRKGAEVKEYSGDYGAAVERGRADSNADPMSYFVDDETSLNLFLGYAVAGKRLQEQLAVHSVVVDAQHPLFVYLPCGVGGAPGGVAYGLKQIYGDNVHCFFTEPTQACCMLAGLASGLHDQVCVQDFGISGKTEADGLAVSRPSAFVGRVMEPLLSGDATIQDYKLYDLMRALMKTENIFIEPSSCAAYAALIRSGDLEGYVQLRGLERVMGQATHVAWATGGCLVPPDVVAKYLETGIKENMKLTVYGTTHCPDTVEALRLYEEHRIAVDYRDICGGISTLKEFLKLRDTEPLFEEVRQSHKVGVPCVVKEDGSMTLDFEEPVR